MDFPLTKEVTRELLHCIAHGGNEEIFGETNPSSHPLYRAFFTMQL